VPPDDATAWGVVVPVKELASAKTRLGAHGSALRQELALAFAADVAVAALACPAVRRVLVVTDDARACAVLRAVGASVVEDRPRAGLNAALAHGAVQLQRARPECGVVSVSADLPCLTAADLAAALREVPPAGRAFVPDADGRGTTLLAAAPGVPLAPAYGEGSRQRHLASGAVELPGTPALRRDVDTPQDLREALALGVGARTARAAAGLL
jgi:2-phospho-L-lactate guanylyltransferase